MRGSIRQRGTTYTAYWSTIDPGTGKRQQHTKGGFRTQGDAQKHLNGVMPLVDQGAGRPDRKMTAKELLIDWLAAKSSEGIRPSTLGMYKNVVDGWLVPHVGALRLDQLNATRAGQLVETLRSPAGSSLGRGELSPRSIQLAVQCLKASTRWAFETGLVARDPLAGFKRPKAQDSMAATGAWSAEEAGAFLSSVADDRLRAAWWLLLGRGLRRGEVSGLKWQNVDLEAGTIRVVETRVVVAAKPTASTPKTSAGRRALSLDDRLVSELKAHWARQARERLAAGEGWEDTDYLFVDELGHPYRPETISRKFKKLGADADLRPIRLHDTRHTAASLMLAAGEVPKVVAEMLGHSSPTITMNIYQHLMPGMGEAAGGRLTGLLAGQ
jgi:integrase